jgi:Ca2+/H+ antiporter, TMEM165/GDT1 family
VNGLLYAFVACFLAGCGARDQVLVAALTHRLGPRLSLLLIACGSGAITSALAAYAARDLAGMMNHDARLVLASLALGVGGLESLLVTPGRQAREPTRSLFAALLVLAINQLFDAARFIVLAIALVTDAPFPAALGGAAGGAAGIAVGWFGAGGLLGAGRALRLARRGAGAMLLMAGVALGLWTLRLV